MWKEESKGDESSYGSSSSAARSGGSRVPLARLKAARKAAAEAKALADATREHLKKMAASEAQPSIYALEEKEGRVGKFRLLVWGDAARCDAVQLVLSY